MQPEFIVAQASTEDIQGIVLVFKENSADFSLLPKTAKDIHKMIADFVVVKTQAGEVLGCAALYADTPTLAETCSVGVRPQHQGKGVGALLMNQCEATARACGIQKLWLATLKPQYFARFGYQSVSRRTFPFHIAFRKLGQVFRLPPRMWARELLAPFTFMAKELK